MFTKRWEAEWSNSNEIDVKIKFSFYLDISEKARKNYINQVISEYDKRGYKLESQRTSPGLVYDLCLTFVQEGFK